MAAKNKQGASETFQKGKETFPAETPKKTKAGCNCEDDCAKCQEEMRKALKGEAFEEGIGKHSAKDLNDASITVFGELSSREAKGADQIATQQRESEGIAAMLYNRQNAVSGGGVPKGSNFLGGGSAPKTLGGVATARGQFHGYKGGKQTLEELNKGELKGEPCRRQCQRWRASKKAVEKFARDPAALDQYNQDNGKFYYNRAIYQPGGVTRTQDVSRGEVRIGGTDFSSRPMGTDARPDN